MPGDKADVVMFGPKPIIEEALTKAPGLHLHRAWAAPDHDAFIAKIAPTVRAHRGGRRARPRRRRLHVALPQARNRVELRRRLRPHRRQMGGRARHHRHQHAGRAQRGSRRHRARPAALHRARICRRPSAICAPANGRSRATISSPPSLRDRTVGIVGMGRIGKAIARRLDAMKVPVVYHSRRPRGRSLQALSEPHRDGARRRRAASSSRRAAPRPGT